MGLPGDRPAGSRPENCVPGIQRLLLQESHVQAFLRPGLARSGNGATPCTLALAAQYSPSGQIQTRFQERSGKAVTHFAATLPPPESDLAQQLTQDPYAFDFAAMTDRSKERELETQLVDHVQKFLLDLGQGFAFVGQQVRLGMYMAAVDDLLAHPDDQPAIGLLLCKSKSNVVAEYALRGYTVPIGVAEWKTPIMDSLPEEFASSLPSIEEIEEIEFELARHPTDDGTDASIIPEGPAGG